MCIRDSTTAGLISRIIGFYYKVFLASMIGAEGIGIYQMIFPLYVPVSYTHLDVYKRQVIESSPAVTVSARAYLP